MDPASDSPLQRLQYKPLDASRNEIRVLSFEPSSKPDDLSSRLDRILGPGLGPLPSLTLEHVSLDDFKPEYTKFRTERPTQWNRSQVNDAWCEQFEFELGSTSSDVFAPLLGSHGATTQQSVICGGAQMIRKQS